MILAVQERLNVIPKPLIWLSIKLFSLSLSMNIVTSFMDINMSIYRPVISLFFSISLFGCINNSEDSNSALSTSASDSSSSISLETAGSNLVPYLTARYQNVIDASSFQVSDPQASSGNKTTHNTLNDYVDDYFYSDNASSDLTFTMSGYSNRAELRVLNNFSTADSNYQQRLVASVLPITPSLSIANSDVSKDSITFLQVHNKGTVVSDATEGILSHPLLRVTCESFRSLNGVDYDSYYWAVLKNNAYECGEGNDDSYYGKSECDNAYTYFPLTDFVEGQATNFEIIVGNSTLTIKVDGQKTIEQDISYWDSLLSYFKAGVYNQFYNGTSKTLFSVLEYYQDESIVNSYGLNALVAPSSNFDLADWYLSIPENEGDGYATSIKENVLNASYQDKYFYTANDGGMVFYTPVAGVTTSSGTKYVRTELREMLRRGDTSISTSDKENNWAFSSIPLSEQADFGGIDGRMTATLAINHVTTTSSNNQHVGRIVIGQIHAASNEPIRLYYHKLPNNEQGALYFAHETAKAKGGNETWYNLLGEMVSSTGGINSTANPSNGITLAEAFSYSIIVEGDKLIVSILQDSLELVSKEINMLNSGYDDEDNYMYFKAGLYLQDNSSNDNDYAQVTFYALNNTHDNY